MADRRPLREYLHRFAHTNGVDRVEITRPGVSPCAAKGAAFAALEEYLRVHPELSKSGWSLKSQADVTPST